MWNDEELLAKARLYFARGAAHDRPDDDEFALWLLLGFEFILRVPLARIHPTLLANPEGPSIMHAAGYPHPKKQPSSIPLKTVVERLKLVVPDFTPELAEHCIALANLRNAELHTSAAVLQTERTEDWLPLLYQAILPVLAHLEVAPGDLMTEPLAAQAAALAVDADKKLQHEVEVLVDECRARFALLGEEDIAARRRHLVLRSDVTVDWTCPACEEKGDLVAAPVRFTPERLEGDDFIFEEVLVAVAFACNVCELSLTTTSAVKAAGLPISHTNQVTESINERYADDSAGWDDYGND